MTRGIAARLLGLAALAALAAGCGGDEKQKETVTGLIVEDLREGVGLTAKKDDYARVHYAGALRENDRQFDSTYGRNPYIFKVGGPGLMKGLSEGVAGMKVGGKRRLIIPPELGFGARGKGALVPPGAALVYEVELLGIEKPLRVEDLVKGKGPAAQNGDRVVVDYTGTFVNGQKFDSSAGKKPLSFVVGRDSIIEGWHLGLVGMQVGGKRRLFVPSHLGYGERGRGPIPPNTDLIFEIELLKIE